MTVIVVDYGRGNLFSLGQALRHLGANPVVSGDPAEVERATRIIFPGVGAFGDAMKGLQSRGLVEALRAAATAGTPILGICIGCQLLLTKGEEFGEFDGLNLIPGRVRRLPEPVNGEIAAIRIPNVGWRQVAVRGRAPVLSALRETDLMYFVHSYAPSPERAEDIAATIAVNGTDIPVAVRRKNVLGVQFHPEKSGPAGLRLLGQFLAADLTS